MSEPRVITAEIGPMPRPMPEGMFDPMPKVTVTLDDGSVHELFEFYPDEINFCYAEFKGLTLDEAKSLKGKKDRDYLRS